MLSVYSWLAAERWPQAWLSTVERVVVARAGARERPLPLCPSKHSLRWVLAQCGPVPAQMCSSMSVCAFVRSFGFRADRYV